MYFFGGSTLSGQTNELWLLSPGTTELLPRVRDNGIVNALSGAAGAAAPGEIVSLFGENLGPADGVALGYDSQTNRLPTSAAGVSVTWNGISAPLYFVRRDQLNVQVPYELSGATEARVSVTFNGRTSPDKSVSITAVRPGLHPSVWNQDGIINSAVNPADSGSIVTLFATGQGVTVPASDTGAPAQNAYPEPAAPVRLEIGGATAQVLFRGQAPFTTGVMQINARIPLGVVGVQPVNVIIGNEASQSGVTMHVR